VAEDDLGERGTTTCTAIMVSCRSSNCT
jgi:hypothetical protein